MNTDVRPAALITGARRGIGKAIALALALSAFSATASLVGLKVRMGELVAAGRRAMLAVAVGSQNKAQLVILDHNPKGAKKTVLLCGKGVTFDTGGISLKPGAGMDLMKSDMGGGAAVLGGSGSPTAWATLARILSRSWTSQSKSRSCFQDVSYLPRDSVEH